MKEIKSLRGRREKHFENGDGTITAYMYDEDVHYMCDGVYRQIDNTLEDKGSHYENKYNDFKAMFSKESDDLVCVNSHEYYLKMYLLDKNNMILEKNKEIIKYKNIIDDVDIDYKVISNKLKESIVLNNKGNYPNSFNFFIDTDLELVEDNKKINAMCGEDKVFIIDSPYMIDNKREVNDNIEYTLIKENAGYKLKLELDDKWLSSIDREFPVIVDPTIINGTGENVYDIRISSAEPNSATNDNYLYVGTNAETTYRTLMKFILPTIETGFSIVKANFIINSYEINSSPSKAFERKISVHEIITDWNEKTATWNIMNDKFNSKIETFFTPFRRSPYEFKPTICTSTVDITNLVKEWYSGKTNNGIMLKWVNEEYDKNITPFMFYAKEEDEVKEGEQLKEARRPFLTITYKNQTGLVSYMDYTDINFNYGTAYVNNRNGNLVNIYNLIGTLSSRLSASLGIVYNTSDVIINGINSFAKGWKFTLEESLEEETIQENTWIKYINNSGANHYFYKIPESEEYIDEDGMSLKIKKIEESYEMTDKDGNKKLFTKVNNKNLLTKIIDVEYNEVNIVYSNGKITKIIDASKEEINIIYEKNRIFLKTTNDVASININDNKVKSIENKLGIITFEYNINNLISKIIDDKTTPKEIEYYDVNPFKVKKVIESIKPNRNGVKRTLEFIYGYSTTTIKDFKGFRTVYTFNDNGSIINTASFHGEEYELSEAYASETLSNMYSEFANVNNKPASIKPKKSYVNNYLINSSFENGLDNCNFIINGNIERVRNNEYSGYYSLKAKDTITLTMDNYNNELNLATLSFYIKTSVNDYNKSIEANFYKVSSSNERILNKTKVIPCLKEYNRYDFSEYIGENNKYQLELIIPNGIDAYIDDLQLEDGEVANLRNLIENSNFLNSLEGWDLSGESNAFIICGTDEKYLKILSHPDKEFTAGFNMNLKGKKGEAFELSFWYKNEGITPVLEGYELQGNFVNIQVGHVNGEFGMCTKNIYLEPYTTEWQYFTTTFVAQADFESARLNVLSIHEANALSVTNFMVLKDSRTITYEYDAEGNLINVNGLDNQSTNFKYDENNQLISSFTPKGNNFKYEYDNKVKTRLRKGISPTGISNEIKYDKYGNPVKTIINNVNPDSILVDGDSYEIRLKGTDKFLSCDFNTGLVSLKESTCSNQSFKVEVHEIEENFIVTKYYRFTIGYKCLTYIGERVVITSIVDDKSLFKLLINDNGSYILVPKVDNNLNMTFKDGILKVSKKDKDDYDNQFYFEDIDTPLFIENNSYYTKDGKFITRVVDSLGKETRYNVDDKSGLVKSVTNAKGVTTNTIYTPKEQIKAIKVGNKVIEYEYNEHDLLTKIKSGRKEYNFTYDNYLRPKTISIGNAKLVTYLYSSQNYALTNTNFGNGDSISYGVDSFGRNTSIYYDKLARQLYYDSRGNLARVREANKEYNYIYDLANRLEKYISNDLIVNYKYDINSNVSRKDYYVLNEKNVKPLYIVDCLYNKDDNITKVEVDGNTINYNYDYLGRLINKNINNNLEASYTYITNGDRTSLIINTYTIGNDTYKYEYDELYNITKIYLNDELVNEYEYDDINELIFEKNYLLNRKYNYVYDSEGNILVKKEYNLETNEVVSSYNYEYNNPNWEDQLTKFNNEDITYDAIGNPLTIGDATLTWRVGRRLVAYTKGDLNVSYEYNLDGIRTSKTVNGETTNYILEGKNIMVEESPKRMLYYIYDSNELIGLKYNNQTYFYKKNLQGDIIGLYNSDFEQIVTYTYDAWGKVLSVTDNFGNEITDSNHIGLINPFRYRSYYYDEETKLYYLNSRYYNPEWGRFVNVDKLLENAFKGYNLYLYCRNNPIILKDDNGGFPITATLIIGGIIIAGGICIVKNLSNDEDWNTGLFGSVVGGAVAGALSVVSPVAAAYVGSFAETAVNEVLSYTPIASLNGSEQKKINSSNIQNSIEQVIQDTAINGTVNFTAGKISEKLVPINKGWFRPSTLKGGFVSKYAIRLHGQTAISTSLSTAVLSENKNESNVSSESFEKPDVFHKAIFIYNHN